MRDGTLERRGDRQMIRFERRLEHPVDRVWRALIEPAELRKWLAVAEIDPVEGGDVVLRWQNTDDEGNRAIARGTVTAVEPERVLELDTDIHGRLRWELEPAGEGTNLIFTVDAQLPAEFETKVIAGWHIHLDHLEEVLDGGTIDWPNWDREHRPDWQRAHDRYVARA
jgi:uncharacterized protein YndB with AHSA1/START domain